MTTNKHVNQVSPPLSLAEREEWERPFALKAAIGVTPVRDCKVDRDRLLALINDLLKEKGNIHRVAERLNYAVQDAMASILGGRKEYERWNKRIRRETGQADACKPITHTQIKNALSHQDGGDLNWDRRVVYGIYRGFGTDVSVDQQFGPRITMPNLPYSVEFRTELIPPNKPDNVHWHRVFPKSVKIHNTAITVVYGSATEPMQKQEFTIRLPLTGARISVGFFGGEPIDFDDISYNPTSISGLVLSFADAELKPGEMIAWEIAPGVAVVEPSVRPLHAGVIEGPGARLGEWFRIAVRRSELKLIWRLTARADHILPVVQSDTTDDKSDKLNILRAALIARHIRGRHGFSTGEIPLAMSTMIMNGPMNALDDCNDTSDER